MNIKSFFESNLKIYFSVLLAFISYYQTIFTEFVGDDLLQLHEKVDKYNSGFLTAFTEVMPDRPFLIATMWFNFKLSQLDPFSYKLTNLIIHLVFVVLAYKVVECIFNRLNKNATDSEKFNFNLASFLGITLFATHPISNIVVTSAIQRGVSLSALFAALSFIFFDKSLNEKKGHSKNYLFSILFFLIGVTCKPNISSLVLVLLSYGILAKVSKIYYKVAPYVFVLAVPAVIYSFFGVHTQETNLSAFDYFLTQGLTLTEYIRKYFIPTNVSFYNELAFVSDIKLVSLSSLLIFIWSSLFIFWGYKTFKTKSLIYFFLFTGFCFFIPESSFFPIQHAYFDHRNYLPSLFIFIGLFLLLCQVLFNKNTFQLKVPGLALAALSIVWIGFSTYQNLTYTLSINTLNKFAIVNVNQAPLLYRNYLFHFLGLNRFDVAKEILEIMEKKYPQIAYPDEQRRKEFEIYRQYTVFDRLEKSEKIKFIVEQLNYAKSNPITIAYFMFIVPFAHDKLINLTSDKNVAYIINDFFIDTFIFISQKPGMAKFHPLIDKNIKAILTLSDLSKYTPYEFAKECEIQTCIRVVKNLYISELFFNTPTERENIIFHLLKRPEGQIFERELSSYLILNR